jgi:ABC-type transporter Mla subunit MlaD
MAEPADLLNAWQEAIRQLGRATASLTGAPDQLVGPLRRQGELLEQTLRRQADFEKELVSRLVAPVSTVIDALEQTSSAMRTQAEAFSAASKAFQQASDLVALQASLIERTTQSLRAPAELVRSVRGAQPSASKPRKRKGASR